MILSRNSLETCKTLGCAGHIYRRKYLVINLRPAKCPPREHNIMIHSPNIPAGDNLANVSAICLQPRTICPHLAKIGGFYKHGRISAELLENFRAKVKTPDTGKHIRRAAYLFIDGFVAFC